MRSSGFGTWDAKVAVTVPADRQEEARALLGSDPVSVNDGTQRALFKVTVPCKRRGDDEGIVYAIEEMFATIKPEIDWRIDWNGSKY